MSYAAKYLQSRGQQCTILRTPTTAQSYVSLKRSSKSTSSPGSREAFWEGLILASSVLVSGEVFQIGSDKYLTQSANSDPASGELALFAAKTNATLTHQRYVETVDGSGNIVQEWQTINADVPAFGQIVTAELRQADPGLLDSARYLFQAAKSLGVQKMDRMVYNGANCQVDSVDDVALAGVVRLQLGADTRP
jgi:hypothetical protein